MSVRARTTLRKVTKFAKLVTFHQWSWVKIIGAHHSTPYSSSSGLSSWHSSSWESLGGCAWNVSNVDSTSWWPPRIGRSCTAQRLSHSNMVFGKGKHARYLPARRLMWSRALSSWAFLWSMSLRSWKLCMKRQRDKLNGEWMSLAQWPRLAFLWRFASANLPSILKLLGRTWQVASTQKIPISIRSQGFWLMAHGLWAKVCAVHVTVAQIAASWMLWKQNPTVLGPRGSFLGSGATSSPPSQRRGVKDERLCFRQFLFRILSDNLLRYSVHLSKWSDLA